jgi:outer membrane lipoprotein carrier protein
MSLFPHLRRGVTLLAAALFPLCLLSQQTPTSAHELASRVDRHYDQLHSLKAAFTESYSGLGKDRTESGQLFMAKPGKMRWDYTTPQGKLFLLDGKYAWFYAPGDQQVQRLPAKEVDDLRSPLRFLLGRTNLEKELNGLALSPAPNGQFVITGVPKGQESRVSKISLTVTSSGAITAIVVEELDGSKTSFTFTGEQPDPAVSPAAFQFKPPAGVPVVDGPPPV